MDRSPSCVDNSMRCLSTLLYLGLGITSFGCSGPSHDTKAGETAMPVATPAVPLQTTRPDAGSVTLTSDDEFIANGREIVHRLETIFTNDGQDCARLAADISKLSEDPIWSASTQYEDAHPEVRERFAAEQAEMGERFRPIAAPAVTACAENNAFAAALGKMR
jgi:hypothetical protein